MNKSILIIKNAHFNNTKLRKYAKVFIKNNYDLHFVGWKRKDSEEESSPNFKSVRFLHRGGGYGFNKIRLAINYIVWMTKLFFFAINKKNIKSVDHIFLTDFDVAFPFYLAKFINRDLNYFYEIRDDFALRYKFPNFVKRLVSSIDAKVKKSSRFVIHVDESRIRQGDTEYIVVKNTPFDFYNGFQSPSHKLKIAVIGHLSKIRGLEQILIFANDNPEIEFIFAGVEIFDSEIKSKISELKNIRVYKRMQQQDLFKIIYDCSGIFSIYDPNLEINLKAASNKLYDAMMLGIPVIVNNEILAANFVRQNNLGFLVDYEYNDSWKVLASSLKDKVLVRDIGFNGRKIFENDLDFLSICENKLIPKMESIEN